MEERATRKGLCATGKREVSMVGHVTASPMAGGNCGVPKKMGGGNEVDGTVDKVAFASWTLKGEKDLLSWPSLLILQIRK